MKTPKISGAEFQYPSGQWLEPCGQIRLLCADSGNNKGQHSLLVKAIMREERHSDLEEIKKYLEWQKTYKATNKRDKPAEQDLCIHVLPSDTTRPGYLKAQMAAEICEYADLTDNDIMWDMAKRSIVASFKAGCVMWALNNMTWTRSMADMVEWLTWHGIWSVWAVMGDMLQKDSDTGTAEAGKTGPANMLDSIEGNSFNEQQLDALRQRLGKTTGAASKKQLSVWSARGFIEYSAQTGLYTKTEKYLKGVKS